MNKPTFGKSSFIPDGLKENFGLEFPDSFWDALGVKIVVGRAPGTGSQFIIESNTLLVTANWSGYPSTPLMLRLSITHELGHAFHLLRQLVTQTRIDETVFSNFHLAADILELEPNRNSPLFRRENKSKALEYLELKFAGQGESGELFRLYATAVAAVEALTRGQAGFGHPAGYFYDNREYMEFFATLTEVCLVENPIFEHLLPELYRFMRKIGDKTYGNE